MYIKNINMVKFIFDINYKTVVKNGFFKMYIVEVMELWTHYVFYQKLSQM